MQTNYTSFSKFNNAINYFFGCNPANPYWILLAMYLRKAGTLAIVNDYEGDVINVIAPKADREYWATLKHNRKWPKGVSTISIVGNLDDSLGILPSVYKSFDEAAKKRIATAKDEKNVFLRPQWEASFLLEVTESLLQIDDDWFNTYFKDLFDKTIQRIFSNDRFDLYSQPVEITELVGHICHQIGQGVKKVYNPFAGLGSYALFSDDAVYVGEELIKVVAAIANLRILAAGINGEVLVEDSINDKDYNADLIISTPPFMSNIHNPYLEERFDGRNDAATLLMCKCAMSGIKGIIVTPMSTSFKNDYSRRVRELLIERECLDMVIELPMNIFEGTSIATAIYVINPGHNHKGSVRIINATECFAVNKTKNTLKVDEILSIIDSDHQNSILVDHNTLARNDFSLLFSRYFQPVFDLPEGTRLMQIGELGTILTNRTPRHITRGHFATFSKLSNPNKLKIYLPSDFLFQPLPPSSVCFDQDCIIVSGARGLRANCILSLGVMLHVPASYFCFMPNENVILSQYLVLQLQSDMVQKQVGDRSLASFRRDEFLNLRVIVPSIEDQRKAVAEYQASLISDLGVQVNELKTQRFNEYERNMRLRKHALNQILNEIVPATRLLDRFISNQEGTFTKNDIVAKRSNSSLETYMHKLLKNVVKVQDLIAMLTDEESFDEPESIDMKAFFAEYEQTKLPGPYVLSSHDYPCILSDGDDFNDVATALDAKRLTAYISKKGLVTIFDNIIANALNHGFTDEQRKDYMIRINYANILTEDGEMLEIRILNNGEKLPAGMTPDKVFSWGVGSGTGHGSWQTKNIVEHYGGYIEFNQFDDNADGFNIEYRIILPMTE